MLTATTGRKFGGVYSHAVHIVHMDTVGPFIFILSAPAEPQWLKTSGTKYCDFAILRIFFLDNHQFSGYDILYIERSPSNKKSEKKFHGGSPSFGRYKNLGFSYPPLCQGTKRSGRVLDVGDVVGGDIDDV